jgi:hypothetical protein
MGSSTQKAFSGGGNVHGEPFVMAEFRRNDYNRIVQRLEKIANKTIIRKAINLAAKRAADHGVTLTKKGIAADTTLKPGDIGKKVKRYAYGSPLDMSIGMRISDTARPLSDFSFTPKKPKYRTAPEVEIYKGNKTRFGKGAFVAKMPTGHVGIFERETEKPMPIKQLTGPSVTGLFKANENVHNMVWDEIFKTFEQRVEHEVERLLDARSN